ncbi:hypothetical protein J2D69_10505 [Lysinibacillus sphaericus]|uniref:Uncharacterized protein n=3 Tax=Lysinibacillus TaxID=400634 RepID=B1HYI0_LYSSC|nr:MULTISPECIES: hypothetical protein [Lysinibacillus]MBE5083152.1 hypothetical protein [Bacillus thuringiensis]ACA40141.1 hypothetical protein Bsph_2592 [Lysinibacillus sphaericus C3-41]EWH33381.1 hypothetical protein P799_08385 [Lysinibacillus sphaericus CBAM5]MCS1396463.1 hypothetical protein [Lysinibacillus sp. PB211]MDR0158798.1 hypothetical protein [Lysinibacillus sphaericus]
MLVKNNEDLFELLDSLLKEPIRDYLQQENKSMKEQKTIRNQGNGFYER